MKYEESCGVVVYTKIDDEIYYLIVRNINGCYGFPKGHRMHKESRKEAAIREVKEETNIDVTLIPGFECQYRYKIPNTIILKTVIVYLGVYEDQTPVYQKEELSGISLVPFDKAMKKLPFKDTKDILKKANDFIIKHQFD